MTTAISNSEAAAYISGNSLGTATGTIVLKDLQVSDAYPLLSLVSMIAPSPDWFIGINSFSLLDANENWKDNITLDLFAYDAGTDNGSNYTSVNNLTSPFTAISKIDNAPFNGNKIGTLKIELKQVLSLNKISLNNSLKMYPNPSDGTLHISNAENRSLKSIEFYNLLRAKVFYQVKELTTKKKSTFFRQFRKRNLFAKNNFG